MVKLNKRIKSGIMAAMLGITMIGSVAVGVNGFANIASAGVDENKNFVLETANPLTIDASEYDKAYETLIGEIGVAALFGVFVEGTTTLGGHMDSNLATDKLIGSANFNAGKYSDGNLGYVYVQNVGYPFSNKLGAQTLVVGTTKVSLVEGHRWGLISDDNPEVLMLIGELGSANPIKIGDTSYQVSDNIENIMYSDPSNPFVNLPAEFTKLRALSAKYSTQADTTGATYNKNAKTITFSNSTDAIQYITVNASDINGVNNANLNIVTGNAKLCVINVDMTNYTDSAFLLARNTIDGVGRFLEDDIAINKVIFNFFGNDDVQIQVDETAGTILAPSNDFFMNNTCSGRFIVKSFRNGGEAHFTFNLNKVTKEEETTTSENQTTTTEQQTTTVENQTTTSEQQTTTSEQQTTTVEQQTTTVEQQTTTVEQQTTTVEQQTTTVEQQTTTVEQQTTTVEQQTTTVEQQTTTEAETTTRAPEIEGDEETTPDPMERETYTEEIGTRGEEETGTIAQETTTDPATEEGTTRAPEVEADEETTAAATEEETLPSRRPEVEADEDASTGDDFSLNLFKILLGASGATASMMGLYLVLKKK